LRLQDGSFSVRSTRCSIAHCRVIMSRIYSETDEMAYSNQINNNQFCRPVLVLSRSISLAYLPWRQDLASRLRFCTWLDAAESSSFAHWSS
jgi:hypothetical protein